MAREITERDLANKGVSGLPDVPGLTTEAMQKKFDEISKELLVPRFNEMVQEVNGLSDTVNEVNNNLSKKVDYIDFIDITEDTNFNSLSLLMAQKSNCSIWLCNNNSIDLTVPNGLSAVFQYSAGTSYIAQIMMSYFGNIRFRSRSTDVWSEWKNLV